MADGGLKVCARALGAFTWRRGSAACFDGRHTSRDVCDEFPRRLGFDALELELGYSPPQLGPHQHVDDVAREGARLIVWRLELDATGIHGRPGSVLVVR